MDICDRCRRLEDFNIYIKANVKNPDRFLNDIAEIRFASFFAGHDNPKKYREIVDRYVGDPIKAMEVMIRINRWKDDFELKIRSYFDGVTRELDRV